MSVRGFFLLVSLALLSCRPQKLAPAKPLLNIDSLLDTHELSLIRKAASLEKISSVNNSVHTTLFNSADVNWKQELESFRIISIINKPTYHNRYKIEVAPDGKSNLMVKSWISKESIPIKSLKIYYLENPYQIKRLESVYEQKNLIFTSTKQLTLDFSLLGSNPTPDNYEIKGYQKFIWGDVQYYYLTGHILTK